MNRRVLVFVGLLTGAFGCGEPSMSEAGSAQSGCGARFEYGCESACGGRNLLICNRKVGECRLGHGVFNEYRAFCTD